MRAVVIGAGIAGTAATLLLAEAGFDVTLVEKNPRIGGSCSGYTKRGFHLDIGTHLFSRGPVGPLGEVLRRVGRPDAIRFRRHRDLAELRCIDARGRLVAIPVPCSRLRLPVFAARVCRAMRLGPRDAARAAHLFTAIFAMSEEEARTWDHRTVEDLVLGFGLHPAVSGLFGFLLGLYFVVPYWEASAGEAIWCFRRMIRDNWLSYPVGGAIAIPRAYGRLAARRGARVLTRASVARIEVEQGRVRRVHLRDGRELDAEVVVSTSSLRSTALHLVGEDQLPAGYVRQVRSIKAAGIAVQAKFAVDRRLVRAGALVGGVGRTSNEDLLRVDADRIKEMMATLEAGRVPELTPVYCPVPTEFDPGLAPSGHQILTACSLAPTSDVALQVPAEAWEEAMLAAMRRLVPGLDRHTVFVDRLSVDFIERWIGKQFGPAISTAQVPGQVGDRRPGVTTPVEGLYVAGCGAGARGVGTELAAASAMECVDTIVSARGTATRAVGAARAPSRTHAREAAREGGEHAQRRAAR